MELVVELVVELAEEVDDEGEGVVVASTVCKPATLLKVEVPSPPDPDSALEILSVGLIVVVVRSEPEVVELSAKVVGVVLAVNIVDKYHKFSNLDESVCTY